MFPCFVLARIEGAYIFVEIHFYEAMFGYEKQY